MTDKERVTIGIPCFKGVEYEILDDYMRLAYHLGRRCTDYDFFLAIKGKSEQFRARNAIVKSAMQVGSSYLFMLDDDHVLDTKESSYDLVMKLISHLKADKERGIVGALYAQRGSDCFPVVMKEYPSGPSFMLYEELSGGLQRVDVTGGGCMMIDMKVFDKVGEPWFAPEYEFGTDIQICRKVRDAGFTVWCDTSIRIGHLRAESEVIYVEPPKDAGSVFERETDDYHRSYQLDGLEYSGKTWEDIVELSAHYKIKHKDQIPTPEYYADLGIDGFARNLYYHSQERVIQHDMEILGMFASNTVGFGLDYYCGTAPVGFELALRGHRMHFFDVNRYSLDFLRFRRKKHNLSNVTVSQLVANLPSELNFVLMLDAIEHMQPKGLEETLQQVVNLLRVGGAIITNYFDNRDYYNIEHINMDKAEVRRVLVRLGLQPVTSQFWQKWR